MRILQVITSLHVGGAEKLLVDMIPRLVQRGFQVDILLFDGTETPFKAALRTKGVCIYEFSHGFYNPLYIFKLIKFLRRYDVVHTHNTSPQYFVAFAKVFARNKQVKLVTTEHNTTNRRRDMACFKLLDKFVYRRYDKIICISEKARKNLTAYLGWEKDIITIENGIDLAAFNMAQPYDKSELQIPETSILLMQVAAFRPQKDQDTAIRALTHLPSTVHLALAGNGERRTLCEQLAAELNVADRVHFLGIRTDVPRILKTADIIVMSSHWEGLSLSSVEGMCVEKPFLASDVQGLHEVVDGAGLLFEHENAKQMAALVQKLIEDKAFYTKISNKCRECAQRYDISKTVKGYEQVYADITQ